MRTTTLRSSISSFGPFCSNGSEPRSNAGVRVSRIYQQIRAITKLSEEGMLASARGFKLDLSPGL